MAITLSVPKRKTFPLQPRSAVAAALMQTCVFILAVNWCLQGMRGMDRKELAFRLGAEALLASSFLALAAPALPLLGGAGDGGARGPHRQLHAQRPSLGLRPLLSLVPARSCRP